MSAGTTKSTSPLFFVFLFSLSGPPGRQSPLVHYFLFWFSLSGPPGRQSPLVHYFYFWFSISSPPGRQCPLVYYFFFFLIFTQWSAWTIMSTTPLFFIFLLIITRSSLLSGIRWSVGWLVDWVLWHINLCSLFNAKYTFMQIISSISNNSV